MSRSVTRLHTDISRARLIILRTMMHIKTRRGGSGSSLRPFFQADVGKTAAREFSAHLARDARETLRIYLMQGSQDPFQKLALLFQSATLIEP
jgi:hypothetical protein